MDKISPILIFLILLHWVEMAPFGFKLCIDGPCRAGEYYNSSQGCTPCPDGYFLPYDHEYEGHGCISCFHCAKPNSEQIIVKNCTKTTDAQIGCPPGTYMKKYPDWIDCLKCLECTEDQEETAPCQGFDNRKCSEKTFATTDGPTVTRSRSSTSPIPTATEWHYTEIISSKIEGVDTTGTEDKDFDNAEDKENEDKGAKGNTVTIVVAISFTTVAGLCLFVGFVSKMRDNSPSFSPV